MGMSYTRFIGILSIFIQKFDYFITCNRGWMTEEQTRKAKSKIADIKHFFGEEINPDKKVK